MKRGSGRMTQEFEISLLRLRVLTVSEANCYQTRSRLPDDLDSYLTDLKESKMTMETRFSIGRRLLITAVAGLVVLVLSHKGWSQGCVVARSSVPVLSSQALTGISDIRPEGESWLSPKRWEIGFGYRNLHSHRHFVGSEEQNARKEEGTEVNNQIHLLDFSVAYHVSARWSLAMSVPVSFNDRWSQRTPSQVTHANGIGDMNVGVRMWVLKPPTESRQNISIGFGVKLPTGNPGVTNVVNGETRVVDQSIQLGDGAYGLSLDAQAFKGVGFATFFASGIYLINPKVNNGVLTGRSRPSEAIMSVADEYLYRSGVILPTPKVRGLWFSLGIRGEGIPVRDLFGASTGFRRPGVALSLDPGFIYTRGKDQWSINVPVAMYRNRKVSVPDIMGNRHGDAAFADQFFLVSYARRF